MMNMLQDVGLIVLTAVNSFGGTKVWKSLKSASGPQRGVENDSSAHFGKKFYLFGVSGDQALFC
jgi:hypothetical protein